MTTNSIPLINKKIVINCFTLLAVYDSELRTIGHCKLQLLHPNDVSSSPPFLPICHSGDRSIQLRTGIVLLIRHILLLHTRTRSKQKLQQMIFALTSQQSCAILAILDRKLQQSLIQLNHRNPQQHKCNRSVLRPQAYFSYRIDKNGTSC